jgi:lysophospholipase L1-like esterase
MAFVRAWIQHDLVAIGHAVQAACARPVFTQYVIGKTNELVAQTARDNDFAVCPSPGHSDIWEKAEQFAADGWHLNDRGYAAYARKVADCVAPFVGE